MLKKINIKQKDKKQLGPTQRISLEGIRASSRGVCCSQNPRSNLLLISFDRNALKVYFSVMNDNDCRIGNLEVKKYEISI